MKPPPLDTRPAQAERVAAFLELNPNSTAKEIDAACDAGCITKVLSEMPLMGYGLQRAWRFVYCAAGSRTRQVRVYVLTHWPGAQPALF